jgi:hypothetical protein
MVCVAGLSWRIGRMVAWIRGGSVETEEAKWRREEELRRQEEEHRR